MRIEYIKNGDYLVPNLELKNEKQYPINKYGILKLNYIKENKKAFYNQLLVQEKLNNYLFSAGNEAQDMVDNLIKSYVQNDKELTEKMKETNQLEWVGRMNNYKNMAEEFVLKELIYN